MMKKSAVVQYLEKEADRYTGLAKELALDLLKNPTTSNAEKNKRRAEDHLVRAETFNAAAQIVAGHNV